MSFEVIMPLFLSEKVSHESPHLPFRFVGGFELPTKTIGFMLSLQGVYSMMAQIFLFPFLVRRFGSLKVFRFVVISWPLLYFLVPYLVLLPDRIQMLGVGFCLLWKITAQVLAYPSNAILLTNAAPSMLVLGIINGVAASTASLSRAFGPTISGFIHGWGLERGCTGLAWWATGLICIIGAVESFWMEEVTGRLDQVDLSDEEAALNEPYMDPLAIDAAITAASRSSESFDDHGSSSKKANGTASY
ncbi:hypothetical protein MMC06_004642 [Schaereria dolodes]|nr:hypothetical protein [Schaereria dolodes]